MSTPSYFQTFARYNRWANERLVTHAGPARVRAEPFDAVELELAFLWGEP